MSILNSSYEISVWLDKLVNGTFQEERICVIGSDTMLFEGRVIEPRLTRNINGEKKFSFKMYKRFVDTITGEEVENPFSEYLINEAKVKLYYKDKWYDFYIKNVVENSSTYLYSYELADASVQELSKNGYGVTFDAKLKQKSNLGTAAELASRTLEGTGWTVESEVFVEKVVDNLVYIRTNKEITNVHQVKDQTKLDEGVDCSAIVTIPANTALLGFYSSCKNKPHRFQFIYLENGYNKNNVQLDQDNNISNANCQYYIDIPSPQTGYISSGDFYLPDGFQVEVKTRTESDTTISAWYKAKRYGFSQKTEYVPLLDKYCNIYKDVNGTEYYGYLDSKYTSPILVNNMITNAEFKGNAGWIGSYRGSAKNYKDIVGAKVEPICGRFVSNLFQSAMDDLQNGNYGQDNVYTNYLQVEFPSKQSGSSGILINSGFYDNRRAIEVPLKGDKWIIEAEIYNSTGSPQSLKNFKFTLSEVHFVSDTGGYQIEDWAIIKNENDIDGNFGVLTFETIPEALTEASFKNKQIKLVIAPQDNYFGQTYYIKSIKLYKKYLNSSGSIVRPGDLEIEGTVVTNYIFISSAELIGNSAKIKEEELTKTVISEENLSYSAFIPQYNEGAEKIRTITAKESNYFNILQSIAETFECWMDIIITRDEFGTHKIIKFKNFTGDDNYASFRYGVNLKDIQRTYESKQLATKLIVKQNNNQLAKNGFCTIARAGANPTGENYIYDFQYFHKTGLLDATKYQAAMYYHTNPLDGIKPIGPDVDEKYTGEAKDYSGTNLQNYFNRIKALNTKIEPINDDLINLNMDLLKLKADLTIQEGLVDAAAAGIDEASDEFFGLTGFYPTEINPADLYSTVCFDGTEEGLGTKYDYPYDYKRLNSGIDFDKNSIEILPLPTGESHRSLTYRFELQIIPKPEAFNSVNETQDIKLIPHDEIVWSGTEGTTTQATFSGSNKHAGVKIAIYEKNKDQEKTYIPGYRYKLEYSLTPIHNQDCKLLNIGSHCRSFKDVEIHVGNKVVKNTDVFTFESPLESTVNVTVYGTYFTNEADKDSSRALYIQPNRGLEESFEVKIENIKLSCCSTTSKIDRTFYIQPIFKLQKDKNENNAAYRYDMIPISIPAYSLTGEATHTYEIADFSTQSCSKKLQEFATYQQQRSLAETQVTSLFAAISSKEAAIAEKQVELTRYSNQKALLNKLFYSQYYRFIQEGTWMSEDYVDDNKYYNDSLSVLYHSCYPQVAYNINVIALNKLPGYEGFEFDIGENTYVEDPEFLGKDTNGDDIRVRVAIAEMTENLDDPTQDNIKVQNFKNDFADLFHKITATVQQAQYNSGAYEKAVELAEADAELKSAFLQEGLQSMSAALTVGGQDTVVSDTNGITITDSNTKNQLRLVGGAILMGIEDQETGERKWKTGLTPEGISASLIQAGTVNTGIINIMNATEPTFKWDSFGISAYDVDWTGGSPNGRVDPSKFVRYDKYGLYGINSAATANVHIDGSSWHPSSMDEIRQVANFALTWDGLFLRLGNGTYRTDDDQLIPHSAYATLGKVDDKIYNTWRSNGIPYYDVNSNAPKFVKIFQVGQPVNDHIDGQLVIYDDGTITANNIKLTGGIQWTAASSPSKNVYAIKELTKPDDETWYNKFKDDDDGTGIWHKNYNKEIDLFYCHTDDGGATWQGPMPVTGKSIVSSTIEYAQGPVGLSIENIAKIAKWSIERPTNILPYGYCVYTRIQDIYNIGTKSNYRYGADGSNGKDGMDTITCHIESSAGIAFDSGADGETILTAYIYKGSEELTFENNKYTWYIEGKSEPLATGNPVTVKIADIRGKAIYFEVDEGGDDMAILAIARVGKMILAKE